MPAPPPTPTLPKGLARPVRAPPAWSTYVILALGALGTLVAASYVQDASTDRDRARFQRAVDATQDRIRGRLELYVAMLRGARGYVAAARPATPAAFRAYVDHLDLRGRYPGIQGIGFARRVAAAELPGFVAAARAAGQPDYRVWPAEPRRAEYFPIAFLEPHDVRNAAALGYDMFTERTRREAMERARDEGVPAASGHVTLVQEIDARRQAGFLIYVPVYRGGAEPATREARREALEGYVYSPFRADDLLAGVFGSEREPRVAFAVFDGVSASPAALLHRSDRWDAATARPRLVATSRIAVAGRPWTLVFHATDALAEPSSRRFVAFVVAAGLLATLAAFFLSRAQAQARAHAESNAARLRFLTDATATLSQSLEPATAIAEVARAAVPTLGTFCFADLVDERGALHRVEVATSDPAREGVADALEAYLPLAADSPTRRALDTGEPVVLPDVTDAMIAATAQDESHHALLRATGARSVVVVPLVARGRAVGVLTFASPSRHDAQDVSLAKELARRAALVVDNARLYAASREAVRARDVFLAIASHELKTPLTSLQLQTESLLRGVATGRLATEPAALGRKAATIRDQGWRLATLIDELLDVSRLARGALTLDPRELDLAELARDVAARYRDAAAAAGCAIEVRADGPVEGRWDRARLEQVLTNLVSNAMKYGAGKPITILVEAAAGDRARIAVRDRGIGIAPEDHARVFERFERGVSERNYGGFGLGLWIAREIVRAMSGSISVASAPGEGATFTVDLPREPQAPSPAEA